MGGRKEAELGGRIYGLEMVCKDARTLRFQMSNPGGSRKDIVDTIKSLAFPKEGKQFAYQYADRFPVDGWRVYDPVAEYRYGHYQVLK